MEGKDLKIYVIGYSDNRSTSYLLDFLLRNGVAIEGAIFPKNQAGRSWKRVAKKIQVRGVYPAIRRIYENIFIRRGQVAKISRDQIRNVFFVNSINSKETRDILVSNQVDLVLLTATPIIKPILIDIDGLTILNAHTGWLPQYRGLDANLKALRDNHEPGVSVHKVTEGIDAGEIYLREKLAIDPNGDILKQLDQKELELAGKLFLKAVDLKSKQMLRPIATNEELGTYEPPLTKREKKRILQKIRNNAKLNPVKFSLTQREYPRINIMSNSSSGALVIGGDFQGLGVLRSLKKRGIPAYLIDCELSIGRFSRQKDRFLRCPSLKDENVFLNFLKELAQKENLWGWVVYANDDETIRFLSQHKKELERFYKIPVPDWKIINNVYNKSLTYQLAEEISVATPRTFYPKNIGDLSQLNFEFPVIIKPAIRDHFYGKTKIKAIKALNREELLKGYQKVCAIIDPSEVMIQELIPGKASNLYSLGAFFKDGKIIAKVIAKRSRQHPMEFGHATTYAETVNIPVLEELGTELLRALNYYGLAEVEFMLDPRDGQFKLIEVNGRVWGWHTLAGAAGVDLPYLLYQDLIGEKISTNGSFKEGVKWIRPITDIPTAFLEVVKGRMRLRDYFSSLRGKKEFAPKFSLDDPLPFLMEFILLPYLWKKRGF